MKTTILKIRPEFYGMIHVGKKDVEYRPKYKYKNLKEGDVIQFKCNLTQEVHKQKYKIVAISEELNGKLQNKLDSYTSKFLAAQYDTYQPMLCLKIQKVKH